MKVLAILLVLNCAAVRSKVALYGEAAAEAWARAHGYTEAQIVAARACLKK